MSVLLDALKKAAEEKKNAAQEKKEPSSEVSSVSDELVMENSKLSSEDPAPVGSNAGAKAVQKDNSFQFKLTENSADTEELPPIKDLDEIDSNSKTETISTDHSIETGKGTLPEELDLIDHELPQFELGKETQSGSLNEEEKAAELSKVSNPTKERDISTEAPESGDRFSDPLATHENELNSLIDSLDSGDSAVGALKLASQDEQKAKIEKGLEIPTPNQENDQLEQSISVPPPTITHQDKHFVENKSLDSDGFDWSMDKLPAYSSQTSPPTSTLDESFSSPNPILITGGKKPSRWSAKGLGSSSKFLVSLIVVLFLVIIGFYGIVYYQEQSESLEQSMRKYNIAKLDLKSGIGQTSSSPLVNEAKKGVEEPDGQKAFLNTAVPVETRQSTDVAGKKILPVQNATDSGYNDGKDTSTRNNKEEIGSVPGTTQTPSDSGEVKLAQQKRTSTADFENTISKRVTKPKGQVPKKVTQKASSSPYPKTPPVVTINKTKSMLALGYESYKSGDFEQAKRLFKDIVRKDAGSINALMGLGAIATVEENYSLAVQYYESVLQEEPNDLNAIEAITNLSANVSLNDDWDRTLQKMAETYPKSPVIQNAIGNRLAKNQDWLTAQEHYFNALVNDANNPDYMVNLAVSYDHLGEYRLAYQYYTQALAYSGQGATSFNPEQIKDRLISIKQLMLKGG